MKLTLATSALLSLVQAHSARAFAVQAASSSAAFVSGSKKGSMGANSNMNMKHQVMANSSIVRQYSSTTTALSMARGGGDEEEARKTLWTFDKACTEAMEFTPMHSAEISFVEEVGDADLVLVGIAAPKKDEEEEEDKKKSEDDEEPEVIELTGAAKALDDALGGTLSEILSEEAKDFKNGAIAGSVTSVARISADGKVTKYILVGLGTEDKLEEPGTASKVGSAIAAQCKAVKNTTKCAIVLPGAATTANSVKDMTWSIHSGLYEDNRFRSSKKVVKVAEKLTNISFVSDGSVDEAVSAAIADGTALAKGVFMTKDIVNAPHNVLNSESMANTARKLVEESDGKLVVEVLGKKECEEYGMGSYLGVARGSETEPQFIHITYKPKGEIKKKVGVVGKGLLFDTGGYNIKTQMMELMKFDCGGSAATFGGARAIAALAPEGVEVHFFVAACENMISDRAVVPSDVLQASNGMTIENLNTDAEGRLTLADALVYADKEVGCEKIIELSTLTGACMVALGQGLSGVFTLNDKLADELADCSKVTGDKSWRMPMPEEYNEQLKSKVADIKNIGSRYGGAITAALFLQNFVDKKKPFAHIDIAGPVWDDSTGATGYGAKLVAEWAIRQGK